jgi:hypothetical protein
MFKSSNFKINITNSGINYDDIKKDMEEYIKDKVKDYLPFYTNLQKIEWVDLNSTPLKIEGDYNVSNTLTQIR